MPQHNHTFMEVQDQLARLVQCEALLVIGAGRSGNNCIVALLSIVTPDGKAKPFKPSVDEWR